MAYFDFSYQVTSNENANGDSFSTALDLETIFGSQGTLQMGKKYNINIVFDVALDEITFEPSVEDWESVTKEVQIAPTE